jgi:hypothetical protein
MLKGFIHEKAKYGKMINLMIYRVPIPAMYLEFWQRFNWL